MFKRLIIVLGWVAWKFFINPDMPLPKDTRRFLKVYGPICLLIAWYAGSKIDMPLSEQCFIPVLGLIALRAVWRDWIFMVRKGR